MRYRVEISAEAAHDLETVYRFIQNGESLAAERWFTGLQRAIHSLAEFPRRCPVVPRQPTLRHLLYGSKPHMYRIVFSIDDANARVDIRAVRHGARSPKRI